MTESDPWTTLLSRVEDAGLNASAPPQQRWIDGWLVRLSPGSAKRARCINAVAEGRLPLGERLSLCQQLYQLAGLPMVLRVTPFSRPNGLQVALEERGYVSFDDTRVMVCRQIEATGIDELPDGLSASTVSTEVFAHIIGEFRISSKSAIQAHAQRLANSPVPYQGLVVRDRNGDTLACAQFVVEGGLVGLYDVFTAVDVRGRGLARCLCRHALRLAADLGARVAYLQVDAENSPARSIYRRLGFIDAYSYHYRARPAAVP